MIALCVEDEPLLLKKLVRTVKKSNGIADAIGFLNGNEALEWCETHSFDVAFLDVRLRGMTGLELAEQLKQVRANIPIIFCTGYEEYALKALKLHASGYLMKPIVAEEVQKEIDYILQKKEVSKKLYVECFGAFEAYIDGGILPFKRKKTKELLAYLIDRRGAEVTAKEICSVLWDDESDDDKNMTYLRQLVSDLRNTLKEKGLESIFLSKPNHYAVDIAKIDCDYYHYLDGEEAVLKKFTGEYMTRYSWAETTCAYLNEKILEKNKK